MNFKGAQAAYDAATPDDYVCFTRDREDEQETENPYYATIVGEDEDEEDEDDEERPCVGCHNQYRRHYCGDCPL